jgi:UDP:flavonoid glycosyltransferase YjiC (YdhE family)
MSAAMRALFTTQVGAGHWRPLAPIARALLDAGHEVAFAATPFFCAEIGGYGFQTFPVGVDDWLEPAPARKVAVPTSPPQADAVLRDVFLPNAAKRLPDLLALARSWRPDLIVREQTEYAGLLVAEALALPCATVQISAYRGPMTDPLALAIFDRLRAAIGLPRAPVDISEHPDLLLLPCPPRYVDLLLALPETARCVQHVDFDHDHRAEQAAFDFAALAAARPTVYATLGTAYNRTPGLLAAIIEGLRHEQINLIVTVNHNQDPADFGPQPANVQIVRYLPQSMILPHCDLVVTHGGSGTVRSAIRHGVPVVVLPIAADQPGNARRCVALGLGRALGLAERTPAMIREAVRQVLATPAYRHRASALSAEVLALPAPVVVADWLAELVERRAYR